jgi:predicted signal transduction protein with EAL and GGDEF domain
VKALARWEHPARGALEPEEFIWLAEVHERTMWELTVPGQPILNTGISAWGDAAREITVAINLADHPRAARSRR